MRAQAVNSQNAEREQNPPAQVGNPEDIEKLLKHIDSSASGRFAPLELYLTTILPAENPPQRATAH
jgi:hypothetical protein